MKNWWGWLLLAIAAYLIFKKFGGQLLNPGNPALSNPGTKLLEVPKTRILAEKIIVALAGTPVQFPYGRPVSEVRLSTAGNTGNIFLGASSVEAKDTKHRFTIATGANIALPFMVANLSEIWCDAATSDDGVSVFAKVESQ